MSPPTDREIARAGELFSTKASAEALARSLFTYDELLELILAYQDGAAIDKLNELREHFWAHDQVQAATNEIIEDMRNDGEPA